MKQVRKKQKIKDLEPWMVQFVKDRLLWVMRDKKSRKPLNVSYSKDGLK